MGSARSLCRTAPGGQVKYFLWLGLLCLAPSAQGTEISAQSEGHVQNPIWSPNGQWLTYEVNNLSNTVELWLLSFEEGRAQPARQLRIPGASGSFGGGGAYSAAPTWGPSSQMIFFEGASAGGNLRIYYANASGGAPNELLPSNEITGNLSAPSMSADGSRFAFVADITGNGDIYVWSLTGGTPQVADPTDASENFPVFDSTSQHLAFSRKHNGTEDLFVWTSSADKGSLRGGAGDQTRPRWSPQGVLYFTSERGEEFWDIAIVDPSNSERRIVARDVKLPMRAAPSLTPDQRAVVYVSSESQLANSIRVTDLQSGETVEFETNLVACGEPAMMRANGRTWLAFTALPNAGSDWRSLHVIDVTDRIP